MRVRRVFTLGAELFVIVVCVVVLPTAACARRTSRVVLSTLPAGEPGLQYELSAAPCAKTSCPLEVRLLTESKVLDTARLEWGTTSQKFRVEPVDRGWGVGDAVGPPSGLKAWAGGFDNDYVATVVRSVKLSPEQIGLLVTQRTGVEVFKRWHGVFVVKDHRLASAWTHKEGSGPTWSATQVVPASDSGADQILYTDGYEICRQGGDEQPDRLTVRVLSWDGQRGKLVESPAGSRVPLTVLSFGSYRTIAEANEARSDPVGCLYAYWVLEAAPYEGVPAGSYFVGAITSDPRRAQEAVAAAHACSPPREGTILRYKERR